MSAREEVEKTTASLGDLTNAMVNTHAASETLIRSFGELADGSKGWNIISRILSGTGLWALQNRIRAVGNMIKFYSDNQAKQMKAMQDQAETVSQMAKAQEVYQNILDGNIDKEDAYYQQLVKTYGQGIANAKMQKMAQKGMEETQKVLDKTMKIGNKDLLARIEEEGTRTRINTPKGDAKMKVYEQAEARGLGKITQRGSLREFKKFGPFKKAFMVGFKKITAAAKSLKGFLKMAGKMIMTFLKAAMSALFQILLYGTAIMLLLFLLKPVFIKAWEYFQEFGSMTGGTFEVAKKLWDNLMNNLKPVYDAIAHLFDVFFDPEATFMDGVMAIVGLYLSLGTLLWDLTLDLLHLLLVLAIDILAVLGKMMVDAFLWALDGIKSILVAIWQPIEAAIFYIQLKFIEFIIFMKSIPDLISSKFKDALPGFASGGTVTSSGNIIVGEKGPEILNVPGGSRVTPNHRLTNSPTIINNNITVEVKGRMGASDQEIRDVAKKVGAMINREINRTTSSGVRL